eukprot:Gb_33822 [translate_table: standard]
MATPLVGNAMIDDYYDILGNVRYWWTHSSIYILRLIAGYDPCTTNYAEKYYNRPDVQEALHANTTKIPYGWAGCRIPLNFLHNHQMALLYSLEGLQDVVDWQEIINLQSRDGSFLNSPASYCLCLHAHSNANRMLYVSNEKYLELAKLYFNMLRALHQKETQHIVSWWRESGFNDLTFACQRPVEMYFSVAVRMFESEFVVVFLRYTGGVLGTAEILFQSKKRGLGLSKRLGMGFSYNGNDVAYVAGSSAPLKIYELKKEDFVNIAKTDRPGPTISTSYTSSLGFTIQWSASEGISLYVVQRNRHLWMASGLAKCLGGVIFMSRFRSTTVNLLGGCIAAQNSSLGVANSSGQVFNPYFSSSDSQSENSSELSEIPSETEPTVHPGLYLCDASLIPCAVGLNPSLTIATVAKHVAIHLVGNAVTDDYYDSLGTVRYWWTHTMISNETYRAILDNCNSPRKMIHPPMLRLIAGYNPCTANYAEKYYNRPDVQESLHANTTKIPYRWTGCSNFLIRNWNDTKFSMLPIYKALMEVGLA